MSTAEIAISSTKVATVTHMKMVSVRCELHKGLDLVENVEEQQTGRENLRKLEITEPLKYCSTLRLGISSFLNIASNYPGLLPLLMEGKIYGKICIRGKDLNT